MEKILVYLVAEQPSVFQHPLPQADDLPLFLGQLNMP